MRKIAWTVAVLALFGLAITGTAALSVNHIIAQHQERILDRARAAIGRPVAAERMTVNLWGGIGVRLDRVRIGDDPLYTTEAFVEARAAIVQAKLLPLLRGELEVGRIELDEPRITLRRNAQGRWNFETIGGQAVRPPAGSPSPPDRTLPPEYLPFIIGRANMTNGTITVTDDTQTPPRTTFLRNIDLSVGDVSNTAPISVDLALALEAEGQNIHLRGTVGPLANPAAIPLRVDGAIGPLGPQAVRIEGLHLEALVTPASVQVSAFEGRAFDGACALSGALPRHADGHIALKGECANVSVAKALRLVSEDGARRVDGAGALRLDLRASGTTPEAIRSTVAGEVRADIAPGVIKDVNLVREVLGRLSNLPVIGDLVSRRVKPKYTTLAADPDTHLRGLHATFQIADQRLHTDDLTVDSDDFAVRATGWIAFDQDTDLLGVLTMSQTFSRDVVADIKEARFLLDDQGQLAVPFRMRGRLGVAKPEPDTANLVARLSQGIRSGGLKDLLGRLLGPARDATPSQHAEESGGSIERGLRNLLRR